MNAPLVDETAAFFLRDAGKRLHRIIVLALGYFFFAALLYCRLLCPGDLASWNWDHLPGLWFAIFAPLFWLDWINFSHARYLFVYREHFPQHDAMHHCVVYASECLYKILLCVHLASPSLRPYLTLKTIMIPYIAGYVLHLLGHFVPQVDEQERPEGCNGIAGMLSELGRFLMFVLVVSLSVKVDNEAMIVYDWQSIFWTFEGIISIAVVLLLPVCLVSMGRNQSMALMLTWAVASAVGLNVVSFISVYHVATILSQQLCPPSLPCLICQPCRDHLNWALWPWLIYLPAFAVGTKLMKPRLAAALHHSRYQVPRDSNQHATHGLSAPQPFVLPFVMFRITPTYYSRTCETAGMDLNASGTQCDVATRAAPSSFLSSSSNLRTSVDVSGSILSARGSIYEDIVGEQLCFICYAERPDVVLLECGHAGMCVGCALSLPVRHPGQGPPCPICRTSVTCFLRLRHDLPLPMGLFASSSRPRPAVTSLSSTARSLASSIQPEDIAEQAVFVDVEQGDGEAGRAESPVSLLRDDTATSMTAQPRREPIARRSGGAGTFRAPIWPASARRHAVTVEVVERGGGSRDATAIRRLTNMFQGRPVPPG
jgi:hypothetical protein